MENTQFKTTKIGSKIYRYIDNNSTKGCFHFSKNELSPVKQIIV